MGLAFWIGLGCSSEEKTPIPTVQVKPDVLTRLVSAEGNLQAAVSTPISPPPTRSFRGLKLAWIAADGTPVKKGDVVVRFDSTEFTKQLELGRSKYDSASAKLAKERVLGRSAAAKRDASARLADLTLKKTKRFRERDTEIYSRNQLLEGAVNEKVSMARREHAEAAKSIERGIARAKADLAVVEQRQAALEISQAGDALKSLEIQSPRDGLLILHRNWRGELPQIGEQVWPGRKLAEIPELSEMEVELFVLEVDGGGLAKGLAVSVFLDSRPGQRFSGIIKRVDDLAKQRRRDVPVQYFAAIVALDKTDPTAMKPGQRVRAEIQVAESEGLVVPRQAVFSVDGHDVVFLREGSSFKPVTVKVGAATAGRVILESGVDSGDVLALTDPRSSSNHLAGASKHNEAAR